MFRYNRLRADTSGVFSVYAVKSLRSGFWTTLLGLCPGDSVIDLTAISTSGTTISSMAVKVASWMRFSTTMTALTTALQILSSILFPMTWSWLALQINLSDSLERPLVWCCKLSFPTVFTLVPLPMTKILKVSFDWPICFFVDFSSFLWKPFSWTVEIKHIDINRQRSTNDFVNTSENTFIIGMQEFSVYHLSFSLSSLWNRFQHVPDWSQWKFWQFCQLVVLKVLLIVPPFFLPVTFYCQNRLSSFAFVDQLELSFRCRGLRDVVTETVTSKRKFSLNHDITFMYFKVIVDILNKNHQRIDYHENQIINNINCNVDNMYGKWVSCKSTWTGKMSRWNRVLLCYVWHTFDIALNKSE